MSKSKELAVEYHGIRVLIFDTSDLYKTQRHALLLHKQIGGAATNSLCLLFYLL